jgi:hypothetical protein
MRKSRFTESQIVDILKKGAAGGPIAEILRQHTTSARRRTFSGARSTPGRRSAS